MQPDAASYHERHRFALHLLQYDCRLPAARRSAVDFNISKYFKDENINPPQGLFIRRNYNKYLLWGVFNANIIFARYIRFRFNK